MFGPYHVIQSVVHGGQGLVELIQPIQYEAAFLAGDVGRGALSDLFSQAPADRPERNFIFKIGLCADTEEATRVGCLIGQCHTPRTRADGQTAAAIFNRSICL